VIDVMVVGFWLWLCDFFWVVLVLLCVGVVVFVEVVFGFDCYVDFGDMFFVLVLNEVGASGSCDLFGVVVVLMFSVVGMMFLIIMVVFALMLLIYGLWLVCNFMGDCGN